uniref:Nicastrin n=1 Tax=Globisporangium ultimum (strain ATCC 200006 / CBS 805.95 / DAOM BR144) TaxID=431595 RepID=K3XAK7_GLOUD
MRISSAIAWAAAAVAALSSLSRARVDASAVTAGAPEHLISTGGECVRLFHSQGDVGCRSLSNGDMAALFPIATKDELTAFVNGEAATQESDEKYVLVMPESLLDYDTIEKGIARIGGVFAYPQFGVKNMTFASATPQGFGTVDGALNPFTSKKTQWNSVGNGVIEKSLPFPVVLLEDEATGAKFLDRASTNVKSGTGATYKAFLKYYFGPDEMNSVKCLTFKNVYGNRHPKCDPIGGQSAWAVRGASSASEIVLAMTSMDATSLSHVLAPGANTGASGLVALLAAAEALKVIPDSDFNKKIVFAAFQAEKFGFVGSRRFLSDLQAFTKNPTNACTAPVTGSKSPFGTNFCTEPMLSSVEFAKLALANVSYAIAVDQVGILPSSGNFTVHVNPNAAAANGSSTLVDAIVNAPSAGAKFSTGSTGSLPPTPLTSFVNDAEFGQSDLVGAVIAGYDSTFSSGAAYNSRHDVYGLLDVAAVTKASQVLAESIYQLATSNSSSAKLSSIEVKTELVQEMLLCVSTDWRCDLMKNYSTPSVETMIEYLDLKSSSWPSFAKPTTLYPGPVDTNGQMLVKTGADGSSDVAYYVLYNKTWSDDANRVNLFPNAYEVFTRSFLASAMTDSTTASAAAACTKNQDCADGGKGMECVYPGVCAKQSAYFHFAFSPGLNRTKDLGVYDVVDATMPLWTEPQWDNDIGSYSFPDPGAWIGWISLLVGAAITVVGVVLSRMFLSSVHKMKLL